MQYGAQERAAGKVVRSGRGRQLAVCTCLSAFLISSCASGFNTANLKPDELLITESIPSDAPRKKDRDALSDESTIRNAVSSASLDDLAGAVLHWENRDTGSRGSVTGIEEYRNNNLICRRFVVFRESFEGVAKYRGETCLGEGANWWMRNFAPV